MQERPSHHPATSRRGFLGWLGRVGTAVIGGAAGVSVLGAAASAGPLQPQYAVLCCALARTPGGCPGSGSGFTCPKGWYKRVWYCCYGNRLVGCGECQKSSSSSCHAQTEFACSEYFRTQIPCD